MNFGIKMLIPLAAMAVIWSHLSNVRTPIKLRGSDWTKGFGYDLAQGW